MNSHEFCHSVHGLWQTIHGRRRSGRPGDPVSDVRVDPCIPTRVSQVPQGPADTYPLAPEPLPDHDVPRRDGPVSTTNDPIRARGPAARQAAFQHGWRHSIRTNIGGSSRLESENLGLILLSLADLLVTYFLLRRGPAFYESNPVAQWFFVRWNIAGMAVFKLSAMGLVVVIGEIVERQRPGWGAVCSW